MGKKCEVKLHGMWASSYSKRVEMALKVKGIPYEYIEEDLSNKSHLLLTCNPVHKKIPLLVHNEKPIVESYIILEYIDETWKNSPRLFPEDPYERAKVRFWANYIQQQMIESKSRVIMSDGETQVKESKEYIEKQKVLEEGVKDFFKGDGPYTNGQNLGVLDILTVATLGFYEVQEQVFGVKFMDPEMTPFLYSWVTEVNEHPVVKEVSPPLDKIMGFLLYFKQNRPIYSNK
ncbi:hypothetical protein CsatB_017671 [Cannabis sativa]|uniref:glutathione S-transferase U10 n=1 Tax=Cannabis sativa TaxID=3483 RepID=UPI0029CA65CF|nr:glutathione S-transferase U10 [Cannabis sativa]